MVGAALGSQGRGYPQIPTAAIPLSAVSDLSVTPWRQTANELPQPQVWLALGLVKLNPPPISAVEKSSCMP